MKFQVFFLSCCLIIILSYSSSVTAQTEMSKPKSAYEQFLSNTGTMITKDFTDLPSLKSTYKNIEAKIVRLEAKQGVSYFLSLSASSEYSDKTAAIIQDDLTEINKAMLTIISTSKEEATINIPYRERYFVTNDGFKVGYFQKGTEQTIFIDLDDYQSDDTFFFKSFQPLQDTFSAALNKMKM